MRVRLSTARSYRTDQRGAAAVEMALLVPLLVLLAYGIIEFGIIFSQDLGIGNGAREGARHAVTDPSLSCNDPGPEGDDVIARTLAEARTTFFDPSDLDDPSALRVDVYRGQDVTSANSAGAICAQDGGAAVIPSSDAACEGSVAGDRIYVEVRWQRGLSIPFGPVAGDFEIPGTGIFECEYS